MNYLRLLVALLVLFVAQPLVAATGRLASAFLNLVFILTLAVAATSISASTLVRVAVYGLGLLAFVSSLVGIFWHPFWIELLIYGSYLGFFGLVCARVLQTVFDGAVDANKLYAVSCVYLLAGITWTFLYALTEAIAPGSFRLSRPVGAHPGPIHELIYFSLVTLTTLGYGDVVPLSGFARTAAALEAIFGQAFLAVLVAHLIGGRSAAQSSDR